jgi:hypothetical protein
MNEEKVFFEEGVWISIKDFREHSNYPVRFDTAQFAKLLQQAGVEASEVRVRIKDADERFIPTKAEWVTPGVARFNFYFSGGPDTVSEWDTIVGLHGLFAARILSRLDVENSVQFLTDDDILESRQWAEKSPIVYFRSGRAGDELTIPEDWTA